MIARVARLLVRGAGWLLTPVVTILAALLGATIGAMVASTLSPLAGIVVTAAAGLLAASVGLWLWLRLLSHSPELREVLAVTPEGVPTDAGIAEVLGGDGRLDAEERPPS